MSWKNRATAEKSADSQSGWKSRAIEEKPDEGITLKGMTKGFAEAMPVAGGLLGGAAGFLTPVPGGTVIGAGTGAAAGKALENLIESQFLDEQKTRKDIYLEPVKEGLYGAAGEGAGRLVGKGLAKVADVISEPVAKTASQFADKLKPISEKITSSAEKLGFKPTTGMLSESPVVQGVESTLAQSPSPAGNKIRAQYDDIYKGMKSAGDEVLKEGKEAITPLSAGELAKENIKSTVATRLKPAVQVYEDLSRDASLIDLNPRSVDIISKNIKKIPGSQFKTSSASGIMQNISDDVANLKTLDQLRELKTLVGREMRDSTQSTKFQLSQVVDKLNRLERRTIAENARNAARNLREGDDIAKSMLADLRMANKIYATTSKDVSNLSKKMGLGRIKSHAEFLQKISDVPDEKLVEKIFNPQNVGAAKEFQVHFPQAFDYARKAKLGQMYTKALGKEDAIEIPKLLRETSRLSPEARKMLLGENADAVLNDIKVVYESLPAKMGPSGTPQGHRFRTFSMLNPTNWFQTLNEYVQRYALENPKQAAKLMSIKKAGTGMLREGMGPAAQVGAGFLRNVDREE